MPRVIRRRVLCRGRRMVFGQVLADLDGREVWFDALLHGGAVAILVVEDDRVLLEKQFRPVVGEWVYEIPAGTIEEGEEPVETARRELVEETGYEPRELVLLTTLYPSPGTSTEKIYIFLARGLVEREKRLEHDELIETMWIPLNEALDLVRRGEIRDAKTIVALLYYNAFVTKD